ncbi:hypothetical protein [Clostridium sp. MD294]|uniref:hypothetical protein n=1 Tax=Clostridium sp. MD294 TaxID=97138 RepID=UPI0002CC4081|nr:hypothetical protein [Clostridium sp. MD294]NDO45989.1 hypothetical protein [Clostridium sp. MD294]USF30350.1 hypothetical protein C820_001791 [Clostridium sp. MD294]
MDSDNLIESGGFIKLYRSILKWEWYDDINVKVLFLHLLLKANYEYKKWRGIEIQKGDVVSSISHLSNETQLTPQQVRTCLTKLKKTGEITIKTTSKYTLIHIEKYSFFQTQQQTDNKQITNKQQTDNKQVTNKQQTNNKQITNEQQTNNKRVTTTKELKELKEKEKREERKEGEEGNKGIYQLIADCYNATCVSLPRCTKLSEAREKAIRARLKKYTIEDFKKVFETAENSDFLKGANRNNWLANFDWLIKDSNMAKVLDGNYKNKTGVVIQPQSSNIFLDIAQEEGGVLF